ncbi:MAG: hypothetical protein M3250_06925 [Thermoproteota archaeon]|nr:hypothetical protein [Thermoproteota archaeon]
MTTTKPSVKITVVIALFAALTFVVAASTFAVMLTTQQAQAVRGEAALHISIQGAANQSPQGAAASSGGCGDLFCG